MKDGVSAYVAVAERRFALSAIVVCVIVVGAVLLAGSEVEGKERGLDSLAQATEESDASYLGTGVGQARPLPVESSRRPSDPTVVIASEPSPTPTVVRRMQPTPTSLPMPTPDGTQRRQVIPILMYHHIAVPEAGADAIRRDLSVSPANFEAQLRYLVDRGYEPISLESLVRHLQIGGALPPKPVVLTFDDGFRDQYTNAFPLLKKYGFTGTFFIITGFVDEGRPEYVSWSEIELMHGNGMEIGSHSYTHPSLEGKSFDYIVWQVLGSKEAIEARTQEPVRFFSYPSGQYDQQAIDVLRSAGYWGAVTVEPGSLQSSERPFEFKRIRVRGTYDLKDFDHWLNHWLAYP
jgi:peptidoglycan/xylan/chitin deacetylase (PgdA/CDA1 family)